MRVAQYCGNSLLLYSHSNPREVQHNVNCQLHPYAANYYASREPGLLDDKNDRNLKYNRSRKSAGEVGLRECALLKRTEKLINSTPIESKGTTSKTNFMSQMLKNSRLSATSLTPSSEDLSKNSSYRLYDSKKEKIIHRSKRVSSSKLKKISNPVPLVTQQSQGILNSSCSMASHFRNSKSLRNDHSNQFVLSEIHGLLETGEFPSKRWKEKYRLKRR